MEKKIIFHANIDDDPEDFTKLQNFAQDSLDHIVADGITDQTRYSGFEAVLNSRTSMKMAPGRLYSGGRVYTRDTEFSQDFVKMLPVAGKKVIAIVAFGVEQDMDVRPRQFLINVETRQAEPRSVALQHARLVNINLLSSQEAPDPVPPLVDAGLTLLALLTLSPAGIERLEMNDKTALRDVETVHQRVLDLEIFRQKAGGKIETLSSDFAGMLKQSANKADAESVGRTLQRLAVLEAKSGISSAALDSSASFYLTPANSLTSDPNFLAKVEEGIRFAPENQNETALQIFNAINPFVAIKNGVLFPAYDRERWLLSGSQSGEIQMAAYTQSNFDMVQKTMSRQRIRYGEEFTICSNSIWWKNGQYDPLAGIFTRTDGERFEVSTSAASGWAAGGNIGAHQALRVRKFWVDTVTEPYWDRITKTITVMGCQIAETWLQGQDMWLDAVGLWFTRLATNGSVTVSVVDVNDYGVPNIKSVIGTVTLERSNMVLNEETLVPLQPIFLRGGKRYALVLTTPADHWVAMVSGDQFPAGTFFYVSDGAYAQGDATKDLKFALYRAKFRSQRAVVDLSGLQLAGGILSIDILADAIVPSATTLSYEIQIGGQWYNLQATDAYTLGQNGNIPPLLPLRAVFNGSVDIMPALKLVDSRCRVSRPRTTFRHISTTRTLPAPSSQIRVIQRYEYFDTSYHTANVRLLSGPTFTSELLPNSFSDKTDLDGSLERTYVFNLATPISTYRMDTRGGTTTAQKVFHVAWCKDYAL